METILEKPQYDLIFRISWLTLFSAIYCYYSGHNWITLFPMMIWSTSILYWYYPDYSWRRYLDIAVVNSSLLTQHIIAFNAQNALPYYVCCILGTGCFFMGAFLHAGGYYWASTYSHIGLHVLTNLGTVILYSGKIL